MAFKTTVDPTRGLGLTYDPNGHNYGGAFTSTVGDKGIGFNFQSDVVAEIVEKQVDGTLDPIHIPHDSPGFGHTFDTTPFEGKDHHPLAASAIVEINEKFIEIDDEIEEMKQEALMEKFLELAEEVREHFQHTVEHVDAPEAPGVVEAQVTNNYHMYMGFLPVRIVSPPGNVDSSGKPIYDTVNELPPTEPRFVNRPRVVVQHVANATKGYCFGGEYNGKNNVWSTLPDTYLWRYSDRLAIVSNVTYVSPTTNPMPANTSKELWSVDVNSGVVSSMQGIRVLNSNPGDLISKSYSTTTGDRYGMGQYNNNILRLFCSTTGAASSVRISKPSDAKTTSDAAFTDLLTVVASSGNVGIGTTNPTAKLMVANGNIAVQGRVQITTTSPVGDMLYLGTGNSRSGIGQYMPSGASTPTLRVFANTGNFCVSKPTNDLQGGGNAAFDDLFTVDSTGSVGIGTNSPTAKLDVRGAIASNSDTSPELRACHLASGNTIRAAVAAYDTHYSYSTKQGDGILRVDDITKSLHLQVGDQGVQVRITDYETSIKSLRIVPSSPYNRFTPLPSNVQMWEARGGGLRSGTFTNGYLALTNDLVTYGNALFDGSCHIRGRVTFSTTGAGMLFTNYLYDTSKGPLQLATNFIDQNLYSDCLFSATHVPLRDDIAKGQGPNVMVLPQIENLCLSNSGRLYWTASYNSQVEKRQNLTTIIDSDGKIPFEALKNVPKYDDNGVAGAILGGLGTLLGVGALATSAMTWTKMVGQGLTGNTDAVSQAINYDELAARIDYDRLAGALRDSQLGAIAARLSSTQLATVARALSEDQLRTVASGLQTLQLNQIAGGLTNTQLNNIGAGLSNAQLQTVAGGLTNQQLNSVAAGLTNAQLDTIRAGLTDAQIRAIADSLSPEVLAQIAERHAPPQAEVVPASTNTMRSGRTYTIDQNFIPVADRIGANAPANNPLGEAARRIRDGTTNLTADTRNAVGNLAQRLRLGVGAVLGNAGQSTMGTTARNSGAQGAVGQVFNNDVFEYLPLPP